MKDPVDHDLLDELLNDESLSFREVARRAGCSDWTVRAHWRAMTHDSRPMKPSREDNEAAGQPNGLIGWPIVGGITVFLAVAFYFAGRQAPPEGGAMP